MSYLVLARRWRPQRFSELVGQPHIAKTLLNGLTQSRVAHAYLFCGIRGVGKTTAARLVARALNCEMPEQGEPCGKCKACISIANDNFIDVIEIDAASNTGVNDVRTLREGIKYAPIEGKAKVYIIDEVHMLSNQAFNALLKILEEPPQHAHFILATTESQKVLPTIISRCQRFDFRRVSLEDLRNHLKNICEKDKIEYDINALDIIARKADGSVRDSLSLIDQVIAFTDGKVLKDDTIEVIGELRLELFLNAIDLVISKSQKDAFLLDSEISAGGIDIEDFINGLQECLILLMKAKTIGFENVDIPSGYVEGFKSKTENLSNADLLRLLNLTNEASKDIRHKFNPQLRLQLLLLRFTYFELTVVLKDVLNNLGNTGGEQVKPKRTEKINKKKTIEVKSAVTRENSGSQSNEKPVENSDLLQKVRSSWSLICGNIAKEFNSSGRMIQFGGCPAECSGKNLTINFKSESMLATAKSCQAKLHGEIKKIVGEVTLTLQVGEVISASEDGQTEATDPAVKMLMDRFDARVID